MGTDRFGLLSLIWVVLAYFNLFDLGLGRAAIKYLAEAFGRSEEQEIPKILWTAVVIQLCLGLVGTFVLLSVTPLLVEHILNTPPELLGEAKAAFRILSVSLPVVMVSSSFFGVLEATQRFDLANAVKLPYSSLSFLLPLLGVFLGFRLPGIIGFILVSRVFGLLTLIVLVFRTLPGLWKFSPDLDCFRRLFTYGAWLTVTNTIGPILVHIDRFLIASLSSMAAVAYYTAPFEAVTKIWIISFSFTTTLFPAFSSFKGNQDHEKLGIYFAHSVKCMLLAIGPIVIILLLFAEQLLQLWLGTDFAVQSATVLQILAVGVLINSLGQIPYVLLQGVGRPDIPAKFHLLELPLYLGMAWGLISHWGIVGAAIAWVLRVVLDALLLFIAAFKICKFPVMPFAANGMVLTATIFLFLVGASYGLKSIVVYLPSYLRSPMFITLFALFSWILWRKGLNPSDRKFLTNMIKQLRGRTHEDE